MDINKAFLSSKFTRFTLKATASAILSLNAKAMIAASCPIVIIGTNLEGTICQFDSHLEVTVAKAGIVGGIEMLNYNTPPLPNSIAINAGGRINSTTSIGVTINNSELLNGLVNNGSISSSSATGVFVSNNSNIHGGITNNGAITSGAGGIHISHSSIYDGIVNKGSIHSTTFGSGIWITDSSSISGGISNTGTILASADDNGIALINHSTLVGDINNSGVISSPSNGNGIIIYGSSVITGGISNSGTIQSTSHTGIGINVASVSGNISNSGIISGALKGLSIHNASTVGKDIINSGTINSSTTGVSIYSATTIEGGISNSGTISGGQFGLSINSSGVISNGINNSGVIQGAIEAIHISDNSTVNNINILGSNAHIIGAVNAVNSNVTITEGAQFTSEGNYNVNTFNIDSNALFNMTNTITATTVNNAGTLAVANTAPKIIGNYIQNTGGTFQTVVSNKAHYGQLTATGAVDLSQNGNINVYLNQDSSLREGDILFNVISGSTLLPPSTGFNVSDNSYIWQFVGIRNKNQGVNLIATRNPATYSVCQDNYCQGAANTIIEQVTTGNSLFTPYATLSSAEALQAAASQATPELTNENIQMVQLITRAVVDTIPMWSSLHGRSSGDAMLYQPGKTWVKPYGGSMTQNEKNTVNGFNASAYGAVIGKDMQLDENWLVGSAFAAGGDDIHGKSLLDGQSISSSAYQGMVYATKKLSNHIYFAGQGLVGYELSHTSRTISLYASTAKGTYNSWFTNIRAETGWSTYPFGPNLVFTPELEASYLFINQGHYQESGSSMDLAVASNNNSSLVLGAYGNGAYHLKKLNNKHDITLTAYAGMAGNVLNNQPNTFATFVAGGSSFSTFGVQFDELVFRGGAGLNITTLNKPWSIELNYDLQAGNNAYSGIGAATIKYKC